MQNITILGATGSIGQSTLSVIAENPDRYQIFALAAYRQAEELFRLCERFKPRYAVLMDNQAAQNFAKWLTQSSLPTRLLIGQEALLEISAASEVDIVMAAIVGAAGLAPTLAAVRAGKKVLLANKEVLVMAGELFIREVNQHQASLLPVDSEHNAIFQCMPAAYLSPRLVPGTFIQNAVTTQDYGVEKIVLTASGGAFRDRPLESFAQITPQEACSHPNWQMGPKVTVDSATMMNKGLELIEAHYLFGLPPEKIEIVIHPQSIIHSMVNYCDGSTLAQLGRPDMRTPIANALAWPDRVNSGVKTIDWLEVAKLEFRALDSARYPGVALAYQALAMGGTAPTILNAANEVAVEAFLAGKITFPAMTDIVKKALNEIPVQVASTLEAVVETDREVRRTLSYDRVN